MIRTAVVTTVVLLSSVGWSAERSNIDPTKIQIRVDPQIPSFYPGNTGDWWFMKKPPTPKSPYLPDELKSDGYVVELESPRYSFHAWDKSDSGNTDYRKILRGVLGSAAMMDAAFDCRITDALLRRLRDRKRCERFVDDFAWACREVPLPLVSFDSKDRRLAAVVRDDLRSTVPRCMLGLVIRDSDFDRTEIAGWDFIIVRPSTAPVQYRGQAAMSFYRSRAPGMPIFLQTNKPDFAAQMFWLTTGAAGFYHDELDGDGRRETADWKNLRAITAFKRYVGGDSRPLPGISAPGIFGAYGVPGVRYFLLCEGEQTISVELGGTASTPAYIGLWYNPLTDQSIVQPQSRVREDQTYKLMVPKRGPWLYSHYMIPASPDSMTTTPAVVVDTDFDLIGEADNELSTGPQTLPD